MAAETPLAPRTARYAEATVHGFLSLGTLDGKILADGESIQFLRGDVVTNRLIFHFRDGSLQDETVTFRERGSFELLTDRAVQKGPSFPHPSEVAIDRPAGRVVVMIAGKDGKPAAQETRMALPPDLANGLVVTLMKNLPRSGGPVAMPMLVTTPKPTLVKIVVTRDGEDPVSVGRLSRKVVRYRVRADLGAIKNALAKVLGKFPPDTLVWVLEGDAPTFVRSEGPAFLGGPPWRIELTSPTWPHTSPARRASAGTARAPTAQSSSARLLRGD
jgi:hypothetical protein